MDFAYRAAMVAMAFLAPLPAAAQAVGADSDERLDLPRFFVRGGILISDLETRARIDPENSAIPGTELVFEDDVGLSSGRTVPAFEAGWRFARNWRLTFEYFGIDRRSIAMLSRDVQFGDTLFELNADVRGRFRSKLYKVQVGWSPYLTQTSELGVSLGVHLTDFLLGISAQASVNGQSGAVRTETEELLAPLPNVGAYARQEIVPDVSIIGRLNWLQLKIDDYRGGLTDAEASLVWQAIPGFSLGAGYRILSYRLDIDKELYDGFVRYRFDGPIVYVTASF